MGHYHGLDLQAALDVGVPPNISLDDFDTDPPSNINDADINESTRVFPPHNETAVTSVSLQRLLSIGSRPRYEIVKRMNGVCSALSHEEVHGVSSDISRACRQCNAHMLESGDGAGVAFRHNLADLLLRRFLLHLHRPLASGPPSNPISYYSRKVILDTAMAILSPRHNEEFSHLLSVGAGIFKTRIIHASLAVAAELLRDLEENGPMQQPSGYRKMLIDAVRQALFQTGERIRLGETNADVRMHMKLSMALCQAEVVGAGGGITQLQDLAKSAKDSLEMSYSLIQARATSQTDGESLTFDMGEQDFLVGSDIDFDDIFGTADFVMDDMFGAHSAFLPDNQA